jgi:SAM-dependent methyltransferase
VPIGDGRVISGEGGGVGEAARRIEGTAAGRCALAGLAVALAAACGARAAAPARRAPDVRYEPSPPEVVRAMLDVAQVGPGDVVYDLGCGDGRVVVEAARRGARGVGVDIDPERVREARASARAAGVEARVEIREGDLFETDLSEATVVMLFLQPELNLRLRPRLLAQLAPGSRVVSHWHDMGTWLPDRTVPVLGRNVYLWTIPARGGPGRPAPRGTGTRVEAPPRGAATRPAPGRCSGRRVSRSAGEGAR